LRARAAVELAADKAIEYFTQATQIDPRYALAWSSLAIDWLNLGNHFPPVF
jgi:tetratricopeptide (TPR) repeat protein